MKTRNRLWLVALAMVLAAWASLRGGLWQSDRQALEAKYASPPSRMMVVDGVPLHVRDEGQGPVVVMLHGSIASLHEWDLVAERLRDHYRIVRIDWPPYGLSGPDPGGVYSTARAAQLLEGVAAALALPPFVLVATSNGGNVALEYYQHHAQRVRAMAFSILPLERPSQTRAVDWRIRLQQPLYKALLPNFRFRSWYRLILEDTTSPGFVPSDAMVDLMYDMNNLPGAWQRQAQYIDSNTRIFLAGDAIARTANAVRVPVLLQWCDLDTVISQGPDATVKRFSGTTVEVVRYADLGHFPMWEDPERFTADLRRFLDRLGAADAPAPPDSSVPAEVPAR